MFKGIFQEGRTIPYHLRYVLFYRFTKTVYKPKKSKSILFCKTNGPSGLQDDISTLLWILFHILTGSNIIRIEDDYYDPSIP